MVEAAFEVYATMTHRLTRIRRGGSYRRTGPWLLAWACAWALLPAGAQATDNLRCGSRLVSIESLAGAVRAACGEPSYRDVWQYYDDSAARYVGDTEIWTYNFGPNQLLRILRFRGGRLRGIETEGYGFVPDRDPHCVAADIVEGLSKYRLVATCGEPVAKRSLGFLAPYRLFDGRHTSGDLGFYRTLEPSYREEWTYNFGARSRVRRVMLENGRVVDVEDGERGFDPP